VRVAAGFAIATLAWWLLDSSRWRSSRVGSAGAVPSRHGAAPITAEVEPAPPAAARALGSAPDDGAEPPEVPPDRDSPVATPTGAVHGQIRRQRDGALVTEGTVALTFVQQAHLTAADRAAWLALDEEQRVRLHEYDEAPIRPDGSFALRLPAPAILRTAVLRPKLQGSLSAQFLETEQPLGDRELPVDGSLELALDVDDGACIEGRVVDVADGFPLAGARVEIPWWSDDWSDWACTTDREGRFRVAGIRREVAGAKSHSEALVRCSGFVTERFLVPPAGDELDVRDVEFALQRGVRIEVEWSAPSGSDPAAHAPWTEEITSTDWLLLPASALDGNEPIATAAWIAQFQDFQLGETTCSATSTVFAPTRDVALIGCRRDGRTLGPFALDGSGDRGPQPAPVVLDPIPADEPDPPAAEARWLALRLVDATGGPFAERDFSFTLAGYGRPAQRDRTDGGGRARVPDVAPGRHLALRVAQQRTIHLVGRPRRPGEPPPPSATAPAATELELRFAPLPDSRR